MPALPKKKRISRQDVKRLSLSNKTANMSFQGADPNKYYRFINESNIAGAISNLGFTVEESAQPFGKKTTDGKGSKLGSTLRQVVGTDREGKPQYSYLCSCPLEEHTARQNLKQEYNDQIDESIHRRVSNPMKDPRFEGREGENDIFVSLDKSS